MLILMHIIYGQRSLLCFTYAHKHSLKTGFLDQKAYFKLEALYMNLPISRVCFSRI